MPAKKDLKAVKINLKPETSRSIFETVAEQMKVHPMSTKNSAVKYNKSSLIEGSFPEP